MGFQGEMNSWLNYTLDKLYRKQSPQLASKSHEICSTISPKYWELLFSLYHLLFILAQTVGNPLPSAFFDEQVTGGRHPNDDKRYTIGKLTICACQLSRITLQPKALFSLRYYSLTVLWTGVHNTEVSESICNGIRLLSLRSRYVI